VAKTIIPFTKDPNACGTHRSSYSVPTGGSFAGVKREGMKLLTHCHVMPRIGSTGVALPLFNMPSWCAQI